MNSIEGNTLLCAPQWKRNLKNNHVMQPNLIILSGLLSSVSSTMNSEGHVLHHSVWGLKSYAETD